MSTLQLTGTKRVAGSGRWAGDRDPLVLGTWALCLGLVLFLALDGGGYSIASHGDAGIVVWWIVIVLWGAGLLTAARASRPLLLAVLLFLGFVGWTALAVTWSISSGRSLADLALVAPYAGILVLSALLHSHRPVPARHTVAALATAITAVAALAVAARLWPEAFPVARQTGQFLSGVRARLAWPLEYWNALAALMDFGVPLLLVLATTARTPRARAIAASALPLVVLCGALTLSRDGALAAAVALVVFFLLVPDRLPKLATGLLAGLGSAAVIAAAFHRRAVQQADVGHAEHAEALSLLLIIVLVCVTVGALQAGIDLLTRRHGSLTIPVRGTRRLTLAAALGLVVVALLLGAPHHLERAWHSFKDVHPSIAQSSVDRFGSTSGEGRYQFWKVAIDSTGAHPLTGAGPGTFQLLWLPKAPFPTYVVNAHSLYVETLAEEGIVGLLLLVGFFLVVLTAGVRRVLRCTGAQRATAAGIVAAMAGFLVFAAFDWIWQVAVLPAAFMLAAGALLTPAGDGATRRRAAPHRPDSRRTRMLGVAVGLGALAAIIVPLASANGVGASEAAAAHGDLATALADARQAARAEPGAAAAQLQIALVLEQDRAFGAATAAAQRAVADEPSNWSNWLTLSRLEAEDGHGRAAVDAYERARSLNPRSTIFTTSVPVTHVPGPSTFLTGYTDYNLTGSDPGLFARARATGASWVRLLVDWATIAPTRPPGSEGANPSWQGYDWASMDAAVRDAHADHLDVILELSDAPGWAEGPGMPASAAAGTWKPDAIALGAFARAVAERYSGRFADPHRPGTRLPGISHFQVWDEPNLTTHLEPQWSGSTASGFAPASPAIYRRMLNAAYAGIKAAQPHSFVVSAGTAPYGSPPGETRMAPVLFLRELLCLNGPQLAPLPCPDPAHLDALDHHPYSSQPNVPAAQSQDVSVVDIGKLQHIVAAARRLHRVLPAGPKPFWITEIDWPTTPPDTTSTDPDAVSLSVQARYLSLAFYELWQEGISHVLWYLVQDDPRIVGFGGAGVLFDNGQPKPAAAAFRFPFVALNASAGKVLVWGRAPDAGIVSLQRRVQGRWIAAGTIQTTPGAVFYGEIRSTPNVTLRASIDSVSSVPFQSG